MEKTTPRTALMLSQETVKSARALRGGKVNDLVFAALVRTLGHAKAQTVDFYLDTRLAVDDAERYEQSVRLLLGEHGGGLVIGGIKTELAKQIGIERSKESLLTHVRAAEQAIQMASRQSSAKPVNPWT